jgi:hypothetical protein
LILAVTVMAIPLVTAAGLPPIAALLLALLVAQLPVQLGHLLVLGWRRNGRLSLAGVVLYRERLRWWQYPLLVVGILAWSWLCWFALTHHRLFAPFSGAVGCTAGVFQRSIGTLDANDLVADADVSAESIGLPAPSPRSALKSA